MKANGHELDQASVTELGAMDKKIEAGFLGEDGSDQSTSACSMTNTRQLSVEQTLGYRRGNDCTRVEHANMFALDQRVDCEKQADCSQFHWSVCQNIMSFLIY
jgi:hypothetical protein